MNIILTSLDDALTEAWKQYCGELDNVEVQTRSILKVKCDAVVSPANSFGFMDGGIDHLYTQHFGPPIQERLQTLIQDHHHGELLVGTAEIVETGNKKIPYLIAAPTMRVPMILTDTVNPYLAARATLLLVSQGTFSTNSGSCRCSIASWHSTMSACPSGIGRDPHRSACRQVNPSQANASGNRS